MKMILNDEFRRKERIPPMAAFERDAQPPLLFALLDIRHHDKLDAGIRLPDHHAIFYITDGKGRLELEGESPQTLIGGCCFLIVPGMAYEMHSDTERPLHGFELEFVGVRMTHPLPGNGTSPHEEARFPYAGEVCRHDGPRIGEMIRGLYDSRQETGELERFNRQRHFLELLAHLWQSAENTGAERQPEPKTGIARTIAYMEQAYNHELTRERLAEMAGMSPGYYSSLFRKETGKSPMDMLAEIRINRAKQLLLDSDSPMRDIAQSVGYSSEYYFSSRFKQVTGLSPSAYVKRSRSRQVVSSQLYTSYLRSSPLPAYGNRERPERVIGLFLEDYLTVLGVKPLMQYASSDYYQKYLEPFLEDVEKLDVGRIDFDSLRRARPDVIFLGFTNFAAAGRYDRFAEIAPTFIFRQAGANWRATLRSLGSLIGREPEAEGAIERYEKNAREARQRLAEAIGGETVALLRLHFRNGLCLYGGPEGYTGPVLYEDLGLKMPRLLQEWSRSGMRSVASIPPETLSMLEADHLFLIVDDGQKGQARKLMDSPYWKSLAAVRNGRVYAGATDVWMTFGMIAHERKIEHALDALVRNRV
jgi:ABC-type Fe3+-hydroxamate transport system substrate-binding protein/AraC-like DNA-binding protein